MVSRRKFWQLARVLLPFPDPTLYAVPFFAVTLWLERRELKRLAANGHDVAGYERNDTRASLLLGLGSVFIVALVNLGTWQIATWLYPYRIVEVGTGWLGWLVAIVGWDFSFYWFHRWEHEHRFLWACHVNHHSSRHFNLSTALRQPWTPWLECLVYPPWALLGVEPWLIVAAGGFDLLYQYGVHTETVGRFPRWIEAVFNTPSHHRVHHGSNPRYLDRNYGGIFIVFDRLFGTFEPESERVVYGLTKNIATFSPWRIAFHEYAALWHDLCRCHDWRTRWLCFWRGPGEQPHVDGSR
jgi:sterol desaturase/sphingolipid hydroxylase (fatty acid hydroxylase superfamily)